MSDFKWLSNLTDKNFIFQFDGNVYEVPAGKKRLFPKDVADHGERRSFALTDPIIDGSGNVLDEGNNIIQTAITVDADIESPSGQLGPILVQKSKGPIEISSTISNLVKSRSEQILKTKGKRKNLEESLNENQSVDQE